MKAKDMALTLMWKVETAIDAHVRAQHLRLANGMHFNRAVVGSDPLVMAKKPEIDVFFITLYFFEGNTQGGGDGKRIPVAAGRWSQNSILYSLIDGPESLATFLHDFLGFSVGALDEPYEEFRGDFESPQVAQGA